MMPKTNLSISGLSATLALLLALWEIYFFFFAGSLGPLDGRLGWFTPNRLGFNMAWLILIYLSYQLISIPFVLPTAGQRFIGVIDGMASLVPLMVVVIVLFGKPHLLYLEGRWEAAVLLVGVNMADLFGGYAFNIALSRRMFVGAVPSIGAAARF
jgi:hypothetical protein